MNAIPKKDPPHQSNLRKGRFSAINQAYHIAKCVLDRDDGDFNSAPFASLLITSFTWNVDHGFIRLGGFVVMSDHYHLLLAVVGEKTLEKIIAGIDKYTGSRINRLKQQQGRFWQQGMYDHALRGYTDFLNALHYIHQNPVHEGLAESAERYPFSTAHPFYENLIDWKWFY